jgi:hypothetical protein
MAAVPELRTRSGETSRGEDGDDIRIGEAVRSGLWRGFEIKDGGGRGGREGGGKPKQGVKRRMSAVSASRRGIGMEETTSAISMNTKVTKIRTIKTMRIGVRWTILSRRSFCVWRNWSFHGIARVRISSTTEFSMPLNHNTLRDLCLPAFRSVASRPRFGCYSQARTLQLVWTSWRETQLGRDQLERFSWTGTGYSNETGSRPTGFSYVYKYLLVPQVE